MPRVNKPGILPSPEPDIPSQNPFVLDQLRRAGVLGANDQFINVPQVNATSQFSAPPVDPNLKAFTYYDEPTPKERGMAAMQTTIPRKPGEFRDEVDPQTRATYAAAMAQNLKNVQTPQTFYQNTKQTIGGQQTDPMEHLGAIQSGIGGAVGQLGWGNPQAGAALESLIPAVAGGIAAGKSRMGLFPKTHAYAEQALEEIPRLKNWYGKSVIPAPVFHGTRAPNRFEEGEQGYKKRDLFPSGFDPDISVGGFGVHFGTPEAALDRIDMLGAASRFVEPNIPGTIRPQPADPQAAPKPLGASDPRVIPAIVSAQNPIRTPDLGAWYPDRLAGELAKQGVIKKSTERDIGGSNNSWTVENMEILRDALRSQGVDAIQYRNNVEDHGSQSYIVWDPRQIALVSNPALLKDITNRPVWQGEADVPFKEMAARLAAKIAGTDFSSLQKKLSSSNLLGDPNKPVSKSIQSKMEPVSWDPSLAGQAFERVPGFMSGSAQSQLYEPDWYRLWKSLDESWNYQNPNFMKKTSTNSMNRSWEALKAALQAQYPEDTDLKFSPFGTLAGSSSEGLTGSGFSNNALTWMKIKGLIK